MNFKRTGKGVPLLLIHGLGGSIHSWDTIVDQLAEKRELVIIDLPGFGSTPPIEGEVTIETLADAVTGFLKEKDLLGIDAVGTSMGARLVLELVRRGGILGAVISLDPGGFWKGWEKHAFLGSIKTSMSLVRLLKPKLPKILNSKTGRKILLMQFSAKPEKLPPGIVLQELMGYLNSESFDELLYNLVYGEKQKGLPPNSINKPLIIGWGKNDKVCLPRQAERAIELFPNARLHWFEDCGHFPQWDKPKETVDLILKFTGWEVKEKMGAHFNN